MEQQGAAKAQNFGFTILWLFAGDHKRHALKMDLDLSSRSKKLGGYCNYLA